MSNLAVCYQEGFGIQKNYGISLDLFEKAGQGGDSCSMYKCFIFTSCGIGAERNFSQALKFIQMAAEHDCFDSFVDFWIIFLEGNIIEQNEEKALFFFQKAYKNLQVEPKFWFGVCLIEGRGIQKSFYHGLELITQASEENYFLADLYFPLIRSSRMSFH
jgi:TPR repeat protein